MSQNALDDYLCMGKPEEKKTIGISENPVSIIHHLFSIWSAYVMKNAPPYSNRWPDERVLDPLVKEAEKISSAHKLPERIDDMEFFIPIASISEDYRLYSGIFYTALLNNGVTHITIPKTAPFVGLWGYKLKRGTIELNTGSEHVGSFAEGGQIINNTDEIVGPFYHMLVGEKKLWNMGTLGRGARGGIFINNGEVALFGTRSDGGIYINHGCTGNAGASSKNAIYINHGHIDGYFYDSTRILINFGTLGQFIDYNFLTGMQNDEHFIDMHKVYSLTKQGHPLRILLDKLYHATHHTAQCSVDENIVRSIVGEIHHAIRRTK